MPLNLTALGGSGTHTLRKTNVNIDENFLYFPNRNTATQRPTAITDDTAFVYRTGTGTIGGLTSDTVYYTNSDTYTIGFASSAGGANIDLTNFSTGSITLNTPTVFQNSFNISSVKYENQQAVKYLTNGTAVTGLTSGSTYFVRNQLTGLGGSALYQFTSWTFTTGGSTGRTGPTISQLRSAYSAADWRNTYLAEGSFQGYQDWTVPEDGVYEFTTRGAPGRQGRALGGGGAIVRGRVRLTKGEIITIVCGQRGELPQSANTYPGSSGATFVVRKSGNIPLFIAGGGSSSSDTTNGLNAVTTNQGGTSSRGFIGGTSGNGATGRSSGGGGGGFFSAGGNSTQGGGGQGFNNGLLGGSAANIANSGNGGFGGGGGADGVTNGNPGGAGGYGGGATNDAAFGVGGGGGSFVFATATNVATSDGLYNGQNNLFGAAITNIGQYNTGDNEGSVDVTLVERSVFGFKLYATATNAAADIDPIPVSAAGNQYHALVPITVDLDNDTINTLTPHGFSEGEAVNYFFTGTTALGGLNNTSVYYVDRIDDYSFRLSITPDPGFTTLNLTSPSSNTTEGLRRVIVNTATNVITIPNHGFLVDQPVRYSAGTGTTITPLQNNATYYIKSVVDANRFTLSQSLQGPTLDITAIGTGTNHSFILTVVNELEDSLYIPTHGYVSGQTVRYAKSRDFVITTASSSTTTRTITTSEPHGLQVNSRVTFDNFARPTISTPQITVTRIASAGTTRTLTLASSHNLTTGNMIQVSGLVGVNASRFNGIHVVTGVPTTNTLTYTAEENVTVTELILSDTLTKMQRRSDYEFLDHTRILTVRSIQSSGTTRTIVTNEPHYFSSGYPVWIQGISGTLNVAGSAVQDDLGEYFNGVYFISAINSTNSFSYVAAYEGTPSNLNPSITFGPFNVGTNGINNAGTVYREVVVSAVPTTTTFSYVMPHSNFTSGNETATGRTSKIGVRINNRNYGVSQFGPTAKIARLDLDVAHDLQVGDRFTTRSISGNNADAFNGSYRVLSIPSSTSLTYTPNDITATVAKRRLEGNTSVILDTTTPHDYLVGNFFYHEGASGADSAFWNHDVNIISRESTTTTRTINTDNPHFLAVGDRIKIVSMTGANASEFIGEFTVASTPTSTRFTYTGVNSVNIALVSVTGIVRKAFSIATIPSFTVSNRARAANVVSITTTANHTFVIGDTIRIDNIGGANPEVFTGEFVITSVPAANQFTFNTATSGTVTLASVSGNITGVNQIRYTIPTFTRTITNRSLVSNTVASFTTQFQHDLAVGSTITTSSLSGNNTGIFTGTFTVASVPSATTFTVTRPQAANVTTFTVTSRSRTTNVADVTFNTTHNLKIGDVITISNMSGIDAGVFNGTWTIATVPATNRVTFLTPTSGTVSSLTVTGDIRVDQVAAEAITGTVTLNSTAVQTPTTGTLSLREIPSAAVTGELVTDTKIAGLNNQQIYYIQRVDANTVRLFNDINLTSATNIQTVGIGTHSLVTFSVDVVADTITIPNHGFTLGELVEYDTVGQTAIGGLTSGVPYYVVPVNGNTFKLASTAQNAQDGVTVDLTTATTPVGRHKLKSLIRTPDGTYTIASVLDANRFTVTAAGQVPVIVKTFNPRTSIDLTQNIIKIVSHGFNTGTEITYSNGGDTSIGGLTNNVHYYVIVVNKDWIRLAETQINAESGIPLTLSTFGAGVAHTLTSVQINGQVTGTGTITTTSGSVLVNGSGTSFSKIVKVGDRFRIFPPDTTTNGYFASTDVNTTSNEITLAAHPFVTGDSVVFTPGSGGPRRDIFQISKSGATVTIRTREAHGYIAGNTVTISNLSNTQASTEFNGTFTIATVPDAYQFTYTHPLSISVAVSNETQTTGLAQTTGAGGVSPNPLVSGYYYFVRSIPNSTVFSINNRNRTSNILDFTTTVNHNLRAGNTFTVSAISGTNPEVFNGTFVVASVPAANRVQAIATVQGADLGALVVTGTLTPNSSNTVTLHSLKSDAEGNLNAVDLTTQGSGFALQLTKTVPATPIIRKIAAIGGDSQVTVDRPYSTGYTGINFSYQTFVYVRPQGYSLHRPFDGGVEMSTGFGTWYGSIIRQTRKYFRYQSGKGIQTSAGINFKPSIDIESAARVGNSQTITVRTRRPHGLINGLFVRIDDALTSQGVTSTVYNGTFQVTVLDSFNFTFIATNPVVESTAYGFPRLHVTAWENGALRSGMFDFQNGMFYEFDGQKLYAVRRSSTQQIAGTCAALQGSEFVFGTNTVFTKQLVVGDYIVLRGQSYKVASIDSDTRITIKPEFKGNSGIEKEFNPGDGTTGVVKVATDTINLINHGFSNNLPLSYNAIDGSPIGGLINGRTYYVDLVDSNNFKLKASPDATQDVEFSSAGSGTPHSFTPAKTGIIATLTVDTRTPQENFSIDPVDGSGPTGYNLDLSKIQMVYMDYSWYGAGKIRYGFKTTEGQVQYIHEYVHNNQKYESYFRSGNLPARYEVTTFDNPTYIPSLFHWGTSVIMDGRFDDDKAYLFTKASPSLVIGGTTAKTFGSTAINTTTDIVSIPSHGFAIGDPVVFSGIGSNGRTQNNDQNPQIQVVAGVNTNSFLTNSTTYFVRPFSANSIILHYTAAAATASSLTISNRSKSANVVTITTSANHGFSNGDSVLISMPTDGSANSFQGSFIITVTGATTFTYTNTNGQSNVGGAAPTGTAIAIRNAVNFLSQGNGTSTFQLSPAGSANNTSGTNYQPLISLRLSPSVSEGLTGALGDRDIINRMQLRLNEIGVQTNQLVDVKVLLNGRLNNLNFGPVENPSLVQTIAHTSNDTISGGVLVYNFRANGNNGVEDTTNVDISELFELSNSILGGNSVFPDGPDILTVAVARLTGNETLASARLSWAEAQA